MIRLEESPPSWPAISLRRALGSFSCIEKEIDGDGSGLGCVVGDLKEGRDGEAKATRYAATVIMVSTPRWARAGGVEGGWEFHPFS